MHIQVGRRIEPDRPVAVEYWLILGDPDQPWLIGLPAHLGAPLRRLIESEHQDDLSRARRLEQALLDRLPSNRGFCLNLPNRPLAEVLVEAVEGDFEAVANGKPQR